MLLTDRWPDLAGLPRVSIATLPTRVVPLAATSRRVGSNVTCKRDDETALPYGGNKVRKLEWLIGEALARDARAIVTVGAEGSHHVLATALYAKQNGLAVHAVLFPQPRTPHVEEVLRADALAGATLHRASSAITAAAVIARVVAKLRVGGARPYVVPPGGSSPVGAVGYVEAGLEIGSAIDARAVEEPDAIFVAAGSGGTAVGLAIGLAAFGLVTRVVAVRVTSRLAIHRSRVERMTRATVARLCAVDPRFPSVADIAASRIAIDASMRGPAYGAPVAEGTIATRLAAEDGITLDPTYTAKAFAAMLAAARRKEAGKRCMFLSTLSSADMAPLLREPTDR